LQAVKELGLDCPMFLTQNDGTLARSELNLMFLIVVVDVFVVDTAEKNILFYRNQLLMILQKLVDGAGKQVLPVDI